jgi:hypothetical protein
MGQTKHFMAKILQLELFQVRKPQFRKTWMTVSVLQLWGNTKIRNPTLRKMRKKRKHGGGSELK